MQNEEEDEEKPAKSSTTLIIVEWWFPLLLPPHHIGTNELMQTLLVLPLLGMSSILAVLQMRRSSRVQHSVECFRSTCSSTDK